MLLGYNHNVNYKGLIFHIQTEDSGVKNPHIITLLYREGVILCSKKTSYADILKIESLEAVVEDLMKEQHKDMLRRLKSGEFDARAFGNSQQSAPAEAIPAKQAEAAAVETQKKEVTGIDLLFQETVIADIPAEKNNESGDNKSRKTDSVSLDDAILNFFGASK